MTTSFSRGALRTPLIGALMALVHAGRFYLDLNLPITSASRLTSCAVVAGGAQ